PVSGRLIRHLSSIATVDQDRKLGSTILGTLGIYVVIQMATLSLMRHWFQSPPGTFLIYFCNDMMIHLFLSAVYFQVAIFVYAASIYQRRLQDLVLHRPHLTMAGLVCIKRQVAA